MTFRSSITLVFPLALVTLCSSAKAQPQTQNLAPTAKPKTDAERNSEGRNRFFESMNSKLKGFGLSPDEIEAVSSFVESQEEGRKYIRKAAYQVQLAQDMSDEEFDRYWSDYTFVAGTFRQRREEVLKPLKEKIKWKERPKLQAYLSFSGVLSDDLSLSIPLGQLWSDSLEFQLSLERESRIPKSVLSGKAY